MLFCYCMYFFAACCFNDKIMCWPFKDSADHLEQSAGVAKSRAEVDVGRSFGGVHVSEAFSTTAQQNGAPGLGEGTPKVRPLFLRFMVLTLSCMQNWLVPSEIWWSYGNFTFIFQFMQSELSGGSDPKKERADGILCDDIFGETPTGVRKLVRFSLCILSM